MKTSKYLVVVFLSKTEVFSFIERMNSYGVAASTTGTPKEARIGCGISAKIDQRSYDLAVKVIGDGGYNGFFGIYAVTSDGERISRYRIV